jgi:hypothetical protein
MHRYGPMFHFGADRQSAVRRFLNAGGRQRKDRIPGGRY